MGTAFLLLLSGEMREATGWEGTFEDNIEVIYTPMNPLDGQSVNVTIRSRGTIISAANLNVELFYPGGERTTGGYQFKRINTTSMYVIIPGYPGGTQVRFTITVWDDEASSISSPQYSYVVQKVGGWVGSDFYENIGVDWDREEAESGKPFNITIYTLRPDVIIKRADMKFDQVFRMNGYSYGTNVTWWVEAYDKYNEMISSRRYQYEIPPPPTPPPRYNVTLTVYIYDEKNERRVDGATVTFSNETWSYTVRSTDGYAFTPFPVHEGLYTVVVKYENSTYTKTIRVPNAAEEYVLRFTVNPLTYKVGFPLKRSLSPLVLIMPILFIAGILTFPKLASYLDELKERYRKEKRRGRGLQGREERVVNWLLSPHMRGHVRGVLFFILAIAGLLWAPFYPIWLALILAVGLGALGMRYPYLSLILLAILVSPAASYQNLEFGWVFLLFSLLVLFIGFFDYRFSYLVFLTVFLAPFGGAFAIPILGATPSLWLDSLGQLSYPRTQVISRVLSENMQDTGPFLLIILWGALAYLAYKYYRERDPSDMKAIAGDPKGLLPILIIVLSFAVLYFVEGAEISWVFLAYVVLTALSAPAAGVAHSFVKRVFPEEEAAGEEEKAIRTLSEMEGFRRTSFKQVGGLDDIKEELKQAIMVPLLEPEMAEKYGVKPSKGILLFGPPGCGKTLLLRAIASELNVDMISVKCSDVMSKWYGESEAAITRLFEEARKRKPAILLLDEIDAIAKRRDFYTTDDVTPRILSLILSELDGLEDTSGIIVVGTTNMPDLVDPALLRPGRFDKVIYVPPPSRRAREEILRIHMRGRFIGKDVDVKKLAAMTRGFSGADLENLVREAASIALARALRLKREVPIRMADFLEALDGLKPSITEEMMRSYDKLRKEHERKRSPQRRR
ncbi:hypothetical protein B6U83_04885 [Thermoplasmatales archaeon ex4484_36]|nr:MAG: hypothetical protein B6U83_04885 [Thermoplasmatales archaeon ex4484_36]